MRLFKPNIEVMLKNHDVPNLIKALADNDDAIRNSAYKALISIGSSAVGPLTNALQHKLEMVRKSAAFALGEIGDPRAVEALISALQDSHLNVYDESAWSLGIIRDARAIEPLITALINGNIYAEKALVEIGAPAVTSLIAALQRTQSLARAKVAITLGHIADPRAVEPLMVAMQDTDNNVRISAISSLGSIGDARAAEALILALGDKNEEVRHSAIRSLEKIHLDARVQNEFLTVLIDSDPRIRRFAVQKLDELGWQPDDKEAGGVYWATKHVWQNCIRIGAPAVEALLSEFSLEPVSEIVEALAKIGDTRAIQPLIDFSTTKVNHESNQRAQIRRTIAAILGTFGEPIITPILLALQKPIYSENARLLESSLGEIKDIQAVEPLIAIVTQNKPGHRDAAIALGKIGDKRAVEALRFALQDKNRDREVHEVVSEALGKLEDIRGVELLIVTLESLKGKPYAYSFGRKVIKSLTQIGDRRACAPIIDYLFHSIGLSYIGKSGDYPEKDYPWQDFKQDLQRLFSGYAVLITDLIGCSIQEGEDKELSKLKQELESGDRRSWDSMPEDQHDLIPTVNYSVFYCDLSENIHAVNQLCRTNTKVSNNLLNAVKNIPINPSNIEEKAVSANFENFPDVLYAYKNRKAAFAHSFDDLKQMAEVELTRRGNPPYEPSVYLDASEWELST